MGFFLLDVWRGIYVNMLVSYAQKVWVCEVCWGASCGGTLGDFGMSSSFNISQERDKFL